jgi:hypothetical protein
VAGRGRGRGRAGAGQSFGLQHVVALVLGVAFGATLLVSGLDQWRNHRILVSRGLTTTAVITKVHSGRGGPSVDIRFTTSAGEETTTRVKDAESPDGLYEGGTIAVRYDPLDAAGRIESARGGNAAGTRWFLIISGVLLLALTGYGIWWWSWHTVRR